jgi:hypothetical protein
MKKNIQKMTLLFVLFAASTGITFAGEDQCTAVPTPTPPGFTETLETPPGAVSNPTSETGNRSELSEFIQEIIDAVSALF